jgi:hypothetical protein
MNVSAFFNRAKNLIVNPQLEWIRIESETTPKKEITKRYVIPFIILIAICSAIGSSLLSLQTYSVSIILTKVIVSSLLFIGGVYLSALIINELTTSFAVQKNTAGTFKLVSYSFTSFFIASCLVSLLPHLPILIILGLHSVYLFWLGATPVLKISETGRVGFVIVSFLIIIGIYAILSLIVGAIVAGMLYVSSPL